MSISTRLILILTVTVAAVMAFVGYIALRQRQGAIETAMRNEIRAHALSLQIVLEDDYRRGRQDDAQKLIDRLSDNTRVYGVVLFDKEGRISMLSDPLIPDEIQNPVEVHEVISTGRSVESVRSIKGEEVFSLIMPVRVGDTIQGAFEVAQPVSFVKTETASLRRNVAQTTLLVCAIIFLVVLVVTRTSLSRPVKELLGGAAAVGRGDLDYRVTLPQRGGEFSRLALEFNRMADSLAEQRRAAEHDAEERLALERALHHSERLSVAGRLAAGIAHEMGAPLNVIYARAGQMLANPDAPLERRQRNLTIIRAQAERITRIVRQLLDLSRPRDLRRGPVELAQLVADTLELIRTDAKRSGVVLEVLPAKDVIVDGDADLLHQVLLNICLNAIQAMPSGGRLRIEWLREQRFGNGRPLAALRVSDTGSGIANEHFAHIFEPFYTTKEVGVGAGMGLAVSRRIVEEHNGWIEARNNEGGGASFTVYLQESDNRSHQETDYVIEEGRAIDERAGVNRR